MYIVSDPDYTVFLRIMMTPEVDFQSRKGTQAKDILGLRF
jgi:hypothetical protein